MLPQRVSPPLPLGLQTPTRHQHLPWGLTRVAGARATCRCGSFPFTADLLYSDSSPSVAALWRAGGVFVRRACATEGQDISRNELPHPSPSGSALFCSPTTAALSPYARVSHARHCQGDEAPRPQGQNPDGAFELRR